MLLGAWMLAATLGAQSSFQRGRCATCEYLSVVEPSTARAPQRASEEEARPVVIDHLIVVDRSAARYAIEQFGGIEAMARLAVETTNRAMINSGVAATFRLVGILELDQEFRSIDDGDHFLQNSSLVREKRRELKADIVTLCVQNIGDGTTGVAVQEAKRPHAFSTVMASAISGYVVAHEVAHIFGCQHSRGEERADGGQHPYAVGTVRSPYYTIMAYPSDRQNAHELAPVFSGTNTVWQGVRLGSASEDNVRKLRERMYEVSTFGDYLEPRYYADRTEYYQGNSGGSLEVEVKTSEFFEVRTDASWIAISPMFALDDVALTVSLAHNPSQSPRIGRITLSGADGYEPLTITIHQGVEDPKVTALVGGVDPIPYLSARGDGGCALEGTSIDALDMYALTGERVLSLGMTPVGTRLGMGLPPGGYVCRLMRAGRVFTNKIVL